MPPVKQRNPLVASVKESVLVRGMAHLDRLMAAFSEKADKILAEVQEVRQIGEKITKLPKGEKGEKGDTVVGPPGPPGPPGKDGKDGKDGESADPVTVAELATQMIVLPKDGKDGASPSLDTIVKALIKEIEKDDKLGIKKEIQNVRSEVASYRHQLAGKAYGKDTWARGSGTTVSAGLNVTLVPQADGTVQINAAGGGSGTDIETQYAVTAVQAGADVTIDLTQLIHYATFVRLVQLTRNNMPQTEGASYNFTITGSTVTVFNADASDIYNIVYAYS